MVQTLRETGDTLFLNDTHEPHLDRRAWATVLEFAKYLKPKRVVHLGDHFDFYQISRFDKNPKRLLTLQEDIDVGVKSLDDLRVACKDAEFHFTEGNHERRLIKYLWSKPEIANIRSLQPNELLGFDGLDITFWPEEEVLDIDGFVCTHGSRVSKHAGMSAKGELEKWGTSGISGHTHRQAEFNLSNYGGDYTWYENGCLCELNPHYIVGRPNWQHAIAVGDFSDGQATIHQLRIDRQYRILHHGKRFDGV